MSIRVRSVQMMFDAKVAYESTPSFTDGLDIVDKQYVDDIAAFGVTWKQPVSVLKIKGSAATEPSNPQTGDAWLVSTVWLGFPVGTIVEWDGDSWDLIVAGSGGEPPNGTRVAVAASATTPFDGHDYYLGTYNATTNQWSFGDPPEDGDAVLVSNGYYENRAFVYDTTTYWIQIAGPGQYTAGTGIDITGNTISVDPNTAAGIKSDNDGVGISLTSGQYDNASGLMFETTGMETGYLKMRNVAGSGIGIRKDYGVYNSAVQPVKVLSVYDAVAASSEPPSPVVGDAYVISSGSDSWTGGVNVTAGDIVSYTVNGWVKVVSASGTYVPVNTRLVVSASAVNNFSGYKNKVMIADGLTNNPVNGWDSMDPGIGDRVVVSSGDYRTGFELEWDGTEWDTYPRVAGQLVVQDNGITDFSWITTIEASTSRGLRGKANQPSNAQSQDVYIVGSVPAGAFSSFSEDDIVEYFGGNWVKIGVLTTNQWHKLSSANLESPFSSPTDNNKLAYWDGTSWATHTPVTGDSVVGVGTFGTDMVSGFGMTMTYGVVNGTGVWGYTPKADGTSVAHTPGTGLNVLVNAESGLTLSSGVALNAATETKADWDGNGTTWVLANDVNPNYLIVTLNGLVCQKDGSGVGTYTWTSGTKTLTFGAAPGANSITQAYYFKKVSA